MLRSAGLHRARSRLLRGQAPRGAAASPPSLAVLLLVSTTTTANPRRRGMCGLVAAIDDVWSPPPPPSSSSSLLRGPPTTAIPILTNKLVLQNTTSVLNHRGPDGSCVSQGTIGNSRTNGGRGGSSDGGGSEAARWAMGHTRLAIVDPGSRLADMPFNLSITTQIIIDGSSSSSTMNIHLVANGEIYNHAQLYNQLLSDGWDMSNRISNSDCEVIAHLFAYYGGTKTVKLLDGMFAFVIFAEDTCTNKQQGGGVQVFAARDPVGIKPLYYGRTSSSSSNSSDGGSGAAYVFASELKALVGHVESSTIVALPPGHYWSKSTTPSNNNKMNHMTSCDDDDDGLVCYYNPEWLRNDNYAPWDSTSITTNNHQVTEDEIRAAFTKAVQKRMMADVEYGFFLSGGVDSCIVSHVLLPLWQAERRAANGGDDRPIPTYTVGMENSPDVMAARAMVSALGGPKHIDHHVRLFTPDEVFDLIPKIIYHMETYEAELIRSSIPNWLLAERASQDVRMVITGEGADELFAGYLYFQDASTPIQVQNELRRLYNMLGNVNLHRTDRMTMAHGLEARVPFLDTEFTRLVMSLDPKYKMVNRESVITNTPGREKTFLRQLFQGPNANGNSIPKPILWRAKAMQCEGVGEDWVSILQRKVSSLVSDAEMSEAPILYPIDTPQTKEELYYRRIFDEYYHGMEHTVKLWEGGGRAMGAEWKSDVYTREGLKNVNLLSHSLQQARPFSTTTTTTTTTAAGSRRGVATMPIYELDEEPYTAAIDAGYDTFEACLTCGGDDRSLILETGANKYHIRPQPINPEHVFRGSCTGNPPTLRGYQAAKKLFATLPSLDDSVLQQALGPIIENQRSRLFQILDLPDGADIVFCPSGSDAEYIPIAIARALHGNMPISNGVVQVREIGAGSAPAASGKYFSTHVPLIGRISKEHQEATLDGFEGVECVEIVARERCGKAVNASEEMDNFIINSLSNGVFPIVHGVFGGKTGLRDTKMPASIDNGTKSLGVVDACQGRFTRDEIHEWLDQDSLVLFTASKFYQAPPFCGAVIIPPRIANKIRSAPVPANSKNMFSIDGLGGFMTSTDLPSCMEHWKTYLPNDGFNNLGLVLRWEAGLAGMEALGHVPDRVRTEAVNEWAKHVSSMVKNEDLLDTWCIERSIVSIRVVKNGSQRGWLSMSELRDLYRWMSMDVALLVKDATIDEKEVLCKPTYIGQPVDVSETYAIVRIALGGDSLLYYLDDKNATLQGDQLVIKKLAAIARHFDTLKKSGK